MVAFGYSGHVSLKSPLKDAMGAPEGSVGAAVLTTGRAGIADEGGCVRRRWHSFLEGTRKEPAQLGCVELVYSLAKESSAGYTYSSLAGNAAVLAGFLCNNQLVLHWEALNWAIHDAVEPHLLAVEVPDPVD